MLQTDRLEIERPHGRTVYENLDFYVNVMLQTDRLEIERPHGRTVYENLDFYVNVRRKDKSQY